MSSAGRGSQPSIVLHSSWTGIVMSIGGVVLLAAAAVGVLAGIGVNPWTVGLAVVAALAAAVVALDMPIATEFNANGVTRRALLRREHIGWDRIDRIERLRSGVVRTRSEAVSGGLTARVGRRHYMLTDSIESAVEFDDLRRLLGQRAEVLGLTDNLRPVGDHSPTWYYRRAKWRPDEP